MTNTNTNTFTIDSALHWPLRDAALYAYRLALESASDELRLYYKTYDNIDLDDDAGWREEIAQGWEGLKCARVRLADLDGPMEALGSARRAGFTDVIDMPVEHADGLYDIVEYAEQEVRARIEDQVQIGAALDAGAVHEDAEMLSALADLREDIKRAMKRRPAPRHGVPPVCEIPDELRDLLRESVLDLIEYDCHVVDDATERIHDEDYAVRKTDAASALSRLPERLAALEAIDAGARHLPAGVMAVMASNIAQMEQNGVSELDAIGDPDEARAVVDRIAALTALSTRAQALVDDYEQAKEDDGDEDDETVDDIVDHACSCASRPEPEAEAAAIPAPDVLVWKMLAGTAEECLGFGLDDETRKALKRIEAVCRRAALGAAISPEIRDEDDEATTSQRAWAHVAGGIERALSVDGLPDVERAALLRSYRSARDAAGAVPVPGEWGEAPEEVSAEPLIEVPGDLLPFLRAVVMLGVTDSSVGSKLEGLALEIIDHQEPTYEEAAADEFAELKRTVALLDALYEGGPLPADVVVDLASRAAKSQNAAATERGPEDAAELAEHAQRHAATATRLIALAAQASKARLTPDAEPEADEADDVSAKVLAWEARVERDLAEFIRERIERSPGESKVAADLHEWADRLDKDGQRRAAGVGLHVVEVESMGAVLNLTVLLMDVFGVTHDQATEWLAHDAVTVDGVELASIPDTRPVGEYGDTGLPATYLAGRTLAIGQKRRHLLIAVEQQAPAEVPSA